MPRDPTPEQLDALADAFDAGELEDVLAGARQLLDQSPDCAEALHYQAAAQVELGDYEGAGESYERAIKLEPEDPDLRVGAADLWICHPGEDRASIERGLVHCAKGLKLLAREDDPEAEHELLLLEGMGFSKLGDPEKGLERVEAALTKLPTSREALLERAIALFELCRFDAAQRAFERVLETEPDEAWAHHHLGLLAERRKDLAEARRRFSRAQKLSPEEFAAPVKLTEEEFDAAVEDALARLPEHVRKHLENTLVAVEEIPSDDDLLGARPPLSPSILGVFRGTAVGERTLDVGYDQPSSIVLYQRNLERFARSREELIEQIGITVIHEVGHLIGLDEEDLWERGLE
jgi:predicted Zn-dependent protease with MMP-like domain